MWAALGSYSYTTVPLYHSTTKRPLGLLGPPDGCFRQAPYEQIGRLGRPTRSLVWAALGRYTTVPLYRSTTKRPHGLTWATRRLFSTAAI